MGYYIEVDEPKNKAQQLVDLHGAVILTRQPDSFENVPDGMALICVVDNGPFEAAALCYSAQEFAEFAAPDDVGPSTLEDHGDIAVLNLRSEYQEQGDQRPRTWVLMDQILAHKLTGYGI